MRPARGRAAAPRTRRDVHVLRVVLFVIEKVKLVRVQQLRAYVGVRVPVVVVAHLAKHLHHVQVPPRERPRPEPAANSHRTVQAVQIEGLPGALQAAVQDVRDVRESVAASRAVRLFFSGGGRKRIESSAANETTHATATRGWWFAVRETWRSVGRASVGRGSGAERCAREKFAETTEALRREKKTRTPDPRFFFRVVAPESRGGTTVFDSRSG